MTGTWAKFKVNYFFLSSRCCMLVVCGTAAWGSGCAMHKRPAVHWQTAVLVRPIVPARAPEGDSTAEPFPDFRLEIPSPAPRLASVRAVPPRPRVVPTQSIDNPNSYKPLEPILAPQLSSEETAAAKHDTQQSLDTAERNLAAARGHTLNAAQSDLASKVRGFIDDAREAMGNEDLTRARSLAKKAEVLSEELTRSL